MPNLVILVLAVLVLSYVRTDRQTDRQNHRGRSTLYSRDSPRREYSVDNDADDEMMQCNTTAIHPFSPSTTTRTETFWPSDNDRH